MSQFYSKKWTFFGSRPTPLLKRQLRNMAYLCIENISNLKISEVLVISEKEFASVFTKRNDDKRNYQQTQTDYKNRKADEYLVNFNKITENPKSEGRNVFERTVLSHQTFASMLVYSHYLERVLTKKSQSLNRLNKREGARLKKILDLNSKLRDKAVKILDFSYYKKACKYLRKKRQGKDVEWYLVEELLANRKVSNKEIQQRKKFYVLISKKDSTKIFTGKKAWSILKKEEFIKQAILSQKEFKGFIAYVGNVSGKVKVVRKVTDFKNDYQNKIIVSPMTIPQFVPYLKKAKAIVTDEGGINCHAAIASREFKIPCVVGTKIAAKILKDGQLVKVDADKGVVRILKK